MLFGHPLRMKLLVKDLDHTSGASAFYNWFVVGAQ